MVNTVRAFLEAMTRPGPSNQRKQHGWALHIVSAALVCTLVVVFTAISIWQEFLRYQERAETFTQNTTQLMVAHIHDVFAQADALLKTVAYHYADEKVHGELSATRFNSYLNQLRSYSPEFMDIRVLDAAGILCYSTGIQLPSISYSNRDYFVQLRDLPAGSADTPMVFSGPLLGRISQQWVLVLARRLNNPDGSFAGVVFLTMRNDVFSNLFASVKMGPNGAIVLRTTDMAQIDRYPDADVGNRKVSDKLRALIQQNPVSGTYVATTKFDNVTRYYSYLKVGEYPFYMIVGEAVQDFIPSLGGYIYVLLAFSGFVILLTIGGTWRMHRLSQAQLTARVNQQAEHILDASPTPMLLLDDQGTLSLVNQAAQRLFGYTAGQMLGMRYETLLMPHALHQDAARSAITLEKGLLHHKCIECVGWQCDGGEMPLQISLSAIELNQTRHVIVALEDLRERRKAEQQLHELLGLQTAILSHASYAIMSTDRTGTLTLMNPASEWMLGYRADEVLGQATPLRFFDPMALQALLGATEPPNFDALVACIPAGGTRHLETLCLRKDGSCFEGAWAISALLNGERQAIGFTLILNDITAQKQVHEKLVHIAHHDALTGLPNRGLLCELVEQSGALARRTNQQLALLFLDLDRFKPVNDTWGHAAGDRLLKEGAWRISACVRESDVVARVSGDEFVVLLHNVLSDAEAVQVAAKINQTLKQPFYLQDETIAIGVSIGIAMFPEHGASPEELLKHADAAMYKAKATGRDRIVVFRQPTEHADESRN